MTLQIEDRSGHTPEAPLLDWSSTALSEDYDGLYAKVLDDVFTPDECDALIALAQSDGKQFTPAFVNYGMGANEKFMDLDVRDSDRILRFDNDAAGQIFRRLLPYVQEIVELKPLDRYWESIAQIDQYQRPTWELVGLNERLSYLRYGPGQFFRDHEDTFVKLPDGRNSFVTIQVYLGDDGVEGGATRIQDVSGTRFLDVEPKKGRVLIFQQAGIWHSGERVAKGTKYTLRSDLMYMKKGRKAGRVS